MQIEVEDKVVSLLKALQRQAMARQMAFDSYLEQFVDPVEQSRLNESMSLEEFDLILNELAGERIDVVALPADFSRADIYADHD